MGKIIVVVAATAGTALLVHYWFRKHQLEGAGLPLEECKRPTERPMVGAAGPIEDGNATLTGVGGAAAFAAAAVGSKPGWTVAHVARLRAIEGFLRRLAASRHGVKFLLTGSALTHVYIPASPRLQNDVDLMAMYTNDVREADGSVTEAMILEVCGSHDLGDSVLADDDGVAFDVATVTWVTTWEETGRPGARFSIPFSLDGDHAAAGHVLSLDVAFDEAIVPGPVTVEYPSTFGLPTFCLQAIPPELLVAWKLHGLWEKEPTKGYSAGTTQGYWRPKDLYDLYLFAVYGMHMLQPHDLGRAVETAFASRGTSVDNIAKLVEKTFGESTNSNRNWQRFRRKLLKLLDLEQREGGSNANGTRADGFPAAAVDGGVADPKAAWPSTLARVPPGLNEVKDAVAQLARVVLTSLGYQEPSLLGGGLFRPSLLRDIEERIAESRDRLVERQDSSGVNGGPLPAQASTALTPELFFMSCGLKHAQGTFELVRRCLAEWDDQLKLSSYKPPADILNPPGLADGSVTPKAAVETLARHCRNVIGQPCVVSASFFEPDNEPGLAIALNFSNVEAVKCFSRSHKGDAGTLHAFVGYAAADSDDVHILDGYLEGTIVSPAGDAAAEEPAWTRCFVPDGYKKTLAEMKRQTFIVSPHNKPFVELAALLRSLAYEGCLSVDKATRGLFEVHITVKTPSEASGGVARFQTACDKFGVKAVFIQNDTGESPRQLMTASYHSGTLQEVCHGARDRMYCVKFTSLSIVR